jgi:hypothetical protein
MAASSSNQSNVNNNNIGGAAGLPPSSSYTQTAGGARYSLGPYGTAGAPNGSIKLEHHDAASSMVAYPGTIPSTATGAAIAANRKRPLDGMDVAGAYGSPTAAAAAGSSYPTTAQQHTLRVPSSTNGSPPLVTGGVDDASGHGGGNGIDEANNKRYRVSPPSPAAAMASGVMVPFTGSVASSSSSSSSNGAGEHDFSARFRTKGLMASQLKSWLASATAEVSHLRANGRLIDWNSPSTVTTATANANTNNNMNGSITPSLSTILPEDSPVAQAIAAQAAAAAALARRWSPTKSVLHVVEPALPSLDDLRSRQAEVNKKVKQFHRDGGRKLRRGNEPPRNKTHWDCLLEEMKWLANDFKRERKWKATLARKAGRLVLGHHKKQLGTSFSPSFACCLAHHILSLYRCQLS